MVSSATTVNPKTVTDAMRSVTGALLESESRRVTKYLAPNYVIKATRVRPVDRRTKREAFYVTMGRPNWRERQFIKTWEKSTGMGFPIHRIQHRAFPAGA